MRVVWGQGLGREDVVMGLIDQGADPNTRNIEQCFPLYVAALHARVKVAATRSLGGSSLSHNLAQCLPVLIDAKARVNDRSAKV